MCKKYRKNRFNHNAGDNSKREIPDSIPNSVVKSLSADGTASGRESRSLPVFFLSRDI